MQHPGHYGVTVLCPTRLGTYVRFSKQFLPCHVPGLGMDPQLLRSKLLGHHIRGADNRRLSGFASMSVLRSIV
jgi:hypothetical protein